MRLLRLEDDGEFSFVDFFGKYIPRYAILSHTWGADEEEVTFKDLADGVGKSKPGYCKIRFCGEQAAKDGLQFFWVDTCCIDKSSSAELSEAINSMFRWYHDAVKCYVYLSDVSIGGSIRNSLSFQRIQKSAIQYSRWFTRSWTLQELVAPTFIEFFSVEGELLGDRNTLLQEIHNRTGISIQALQGRPLSQFSVDERMSWAEQREAKREEDSAYSLLGIFDIHMPLIYGERRQMAFVRLQKEIEQVLGIEQPALPPALSPEQLEPQRNSFSTGSDLPSRGFWSSSNAQETADTSMMQTSVDQSYQRMEHDLTDNESVYTSNTVESGEYCHELATSFFSNSDLPDIKCLERLRGVLPDLLRGFALRIGGEDSNQLHFQIMKFVHKKREDIAIHFEKYYLRDEDAISTQHRSLDDMSWAERLDKWQVSAEMEDPNPEPPRSPDDMPILEDEDQSDNDDGVEDRYSVYRDAVNKSTAFQWLRCRVHRESYLTASEATTMHAISTKIRQLLYTRKDNRIISGKKSPPSNSIVFTSDWDPLAFLEEQGYAEEPGDALCRVIVIMQSTNGDAEAMTCSEYLNLTWPMFGDDIMELVKNVIRSRRGFRCSITLFDRTKLTAWIESSGRFILEILGVTETIAEVGEVYGWMTAAIRSGLGDIVTLVKPIVNSTGSRTDNDNPFFQAHFRVQYEDGTWPQTGQCWQGLFRNPVVVHGFPIRRRESGLEPGLESSLATLTALLGTRRITSFCGKVFLKGFCTLLVPTKYVGNTVHWHVLFNETGNRISFTDIRVRDAAGDFDLSKYLTLSGIEVARHVVGWCRNVRNYAGSKEANYALDRTRLRQPRDSSFAFDRVSISAGKIVSVGFSAAIGKKDKPGRTTKSTDYHKQLEWMEQRFVVLYDVKFKRAWLIDGLSALLHLVRASLAHRRRLGRETLFDEDGIQESDTPHTGKEAARAVLLNRTNMDLRIYEHWNRVVEEISQKEGGSLEVRQKTERTWEQLPDLVGEIFMTLSMLFDIQMDVSTVDGYGAKVRKTPRRHLEGWEFLDVASGSDPLLPRATTIQDIGLGWVDLTRAIDAITLFGVDFGEILQPSGAVGRRGTDSEGERAVSGRVSDPAQGEILCANWARLPIDNDLLATTISTVRDIMKGSNRDTEQDQCLRQLFDGIYWHSPDRVFEQCRCGDTPKMHCDRVQVLLPTNFPNLFGLNFRSPPEPLPASGAVIFGHSWKFPLRWKPEAGTIPGEGQPAKPQSVSQSSHQSDSGLGPSVLSSNDDLSSPPSQYSAC